MDTLPHRFSVAPMLDWTDRHARFFHRLLSRHTRLYTEMVTTGALLHGDVVRHLQFNAEEHPIALQLGGSEPTALAHAVKLAQRYGYDEVNLNCGCPSERVQRGAFGACLMAEPELVAECVRAMRDAGEMPITVKHRIGIDDIESYDFVRDFVGTIRDAGCRTFIVHARNAILKGLSPKENREVPPLKYAFAYRLKQDFPDLEIVINGGIKTIGEVQQHLENVDGVMVGREAYQNPVLLTGVDAILFPDLPGATPASDAELVAAYRTYAVARLAEGAPLSALTRPLLGWRRGSAGSRHWRRILSDSNRLRVNDLGVFADALAALDAERSYASEDSPVD
ncbi:tRNA dihydrouridine(20/20a) synthase DusA [Chitinasiproducens palmae]